MARGGLGIFVVACLFVGVLVLLTREPEEPWAVAVVIVGAAGAAGGAATLVQLRRAGGGRRRVPEGRGATAARRGVEIAAAVALLLWLRALDGLSVITALFIVATFVVAEVVLSARPHSSR